MFIPLIKNKRLVSNKMFVRTSYDDIIVILIIITVSLVQIFRSFPVIQNP